MVIALTRPVSRCIGECALSFIEREDINFEMAAAQHEAYVEVLRSLGATVDSLPSQDDLPDAVFVEDTVVVVDEVALLTFPSLPSRQPEVDSMAEAIAKYRPVQRLTGDARLEGGDVVRIGRSLFVGLSHRTNQQGIDNLEALLAPHGYTVQAVEMSGCLHLKTACTYVGQNTILANRDWVDVERLGARQIVDVSPTEPDAGNALLLNGTLVLPSKFPETRARLQARGFTVVSVDVSELQKAEAGVTCCSVLMDDRSDEARP